MNNKKALLGAGVAALLVGGLVISHKQATPAKPITMTAGLVISVDKTVKPGTYQFDVVSKAADGTTVYTPMTMTVTADGKTTYSHVFPADSVYHEPSSTGQWVSK